VLETPAQTKLRGTPGRVEQHPIWRQKKLFSRTKAGTNKVDKKYLAELAFLIAILSFVGVSNKGITGTKTPLALRID
jgi:hypothetical protein